MTSDGDVRRGFGRGYGLKDIRLIQAGMGVGVSSWSLANKTARRRGVLGTVSGIAAEDIVTRTLQNGDLGGHFKRALDAFPFPEIARAVYDKYYVENGIPEGQKYLAHSVFNLNPSKELQRLMVVSEFCLVWLAKEGHKGLISVNFLEKIQITHIWYMLGAMLAGVDVVTMGAGLVKDIPNILDDLAAGKHPSYKIDVEGFGDSKAEGDQRSKVVITFDPEELMGGKIPQLRRPDFLAIVSSNLLLRILQTKCKGRIQGYVIEGPTAGGHNAPPRRGMDELDDKGQPVYHEGVGEDDYVDLEAFRKVYESDGIPFWLAGSYGTKEGYKRARLEGANGVQVGSVFALCDDSGILAHLRIEARTLGYRDELEILRSRRSPTGFPFNVAQLKGTLSTDEAFADRKRACSICALRVPYQKDGKIGGYRCRAEPLQSYKLKGGKIDEAALNALCLCNGLLAAIGLGNPGELPIVTLGQNLGFLLDLMSDENDAYDAYDVIDYILGSE